jgi:hypothetical protein
MPDDWTLVTELTSRRPEYRSSSQTVHRLFCFIRCYVNVLTEPLPSKWIIPCLFVASGTSLPNRCLAMDYRSGSTIPAFRRHVTLFSNWLQYFIHYSRQIFGLCFHPRARNHLVPRSRILLPWRWKQYVPPKCRFTLDLHGATSQRTVFFIVTPWKPQILLADIISSSDTKWCPWIISHHVNKSLWSTCRTACLTKSSVFSDMTPCSPLKANRRYGGICRLHLQDRRISQEGKQHTDGSKQISVDFQRTARRHIREDWTLRNHRCKNLRSYIHVCCL